MIWGLYLGMVLLNFVLHEYDLKHFEYCVGNCWKSTKNVKTTFYIILLLTVFCCIYII